MGRMLGYHDSEELDRPDLNKCPDCDCFFASEECPLCGKVCPEHMRAGNRAAVKHKKHKNTSGRVQFVEWYHAWWFIILMLFVMPVVGIVLFFTSPHSKKAKIIATVVGIAYFLLIYCGGIYWILRFFTKEDATQPPVTSDAQVAYTDTSERSAPEDSYRLPEGMDV